MISKSCRIFFKDHFGYSGSNPLQKMRRTPAGEKARGSGKAEKEILAKSYRPYRKETDKTLHLCVTSLATPRILGKEVKYCETAQKLEQVKTSLRAGPLLRIPLKDIPGTGNEVTRTRTRPRPEDVPFSYEHYSCFSNYPAFFFQ